jgi:hypothetical protein
VYLKQLESDLRGIREKYYNLSSAVTLEKTEAELIHSLTFKEDSFKYMSLNKRKIEIFKKANHEPLYLNRKIVKIFNQMKMNSEYEEAFLNAFEETSKMSRLWLCCRKKSLENIWTLSKVPPKAPFVIYKNQNNHCTFKEYIKEQFLWK